MHLNHQITNTHRNKKKHNNYWTPNNDSSLYFWINSKNYLLQSFQESKTLVWIIIYSRFKKSISKTSILNSFLKNRFFLLLNTQLTKKICIYLAGCRTRGCSRTRIGLVRGLDGSVGRRRPRTQLRPRTQGDQGWLGRGRQVQGNNYSPVNFNITTLFEHISRKKLRQFLYISIK